jgi:hypothetical protein
MKRMKMMYETYLKVKGIYHSIFQIAFYYSYIDINFKHNASHIV